MTPYTSLDRIEAAKQQGRMEEKGEEKGNGKEKNKRGKRQEETGPAHHAAHILPLQ